MKNIKHTVKNPWDIVKTPLILSALMGIFYLGIKNEILENKDHLSRQLYENNFQDEPSSKMYNYNGYDVTKGIDKEGNKYLELREGFYSRLERPTTLIWRGDSIEFYCGKDMGRGIHLEDSTHHFKSLTKDSLERIFEELK